ncbi:hypothetical protein KYC5002_30365 [Archangium violaceum]|uniref:hypothetical protein n=1 Tax=Archangium violaceum TaxID=83451 RepID=UPI002B30EA90|nr:hypothetical protein KYC5002_30365 [Archangium gephyra]
MNESLPGMDVTFQAVMLGLPAPLREFGAHLPHRLGLTPSRDGRWTDFWVLDINRDLPAYAAEDPARPGQLLVGARELRCYRMAHHCAAIHGLIADRLVDRQIEPDPRYRELRRAFRLTWEQTLVEATGDKSLVRRALTRTLGSLRRGTWQELRSLAAGHLTPAAYAEQTREKLRWGGTAAWCLLQRTNQPERAALLERSYDLFCFALQCLDDALDCAEDERSRGTSMPTVLGVPVGGLVRATSPLLQSSIATAEQGGFRRLAAWLGSFLTLMESLTPPGDPKADQRAGAWLARTAEGAL